MDFLGLQTELARRLHGNLSDSVFQNACQDWLNSSRKELVALNPNWYWLRNTATVALIADTGLYALASDFVKLNPEQVYLTNTETRLIHIHPKDYEFLLSTPTVSGSAKYFRIPKHGYIKLLPPPNAAQVSAESSITYEYTKGFPNDMSANGDSHGLPTNFEPVLLNLAEYYGWMWSRRADLAQLPLQRAQMVIAGHLPPGSFTSRLAADFAPPARSDRAEQVQTGEGMQ